MPPTKCPPAVMPTTDLSPLRFFQRTERMLFEDA